MTLSVPHFKLFKRLFCHVGENIHVWHDWILQSRSPSYTDPPNSEPYVFSTGIRGKKLQVQFAWIAFISKGEATPWGRGHALIKLNYSHLINGCIQGLAWTWLCSQTTTLRAPSWFSCCRFPARGICITQVSLQILLRDRHIHANMHTRTDTLNQEPRKSCSLSSLRTYQVARLITAP